ncbi:hypothetical protein [Streptomyces sp. NPDC055749]
MEQVIIELAIYGGGHEDGIRLATWARLERTSTGNLYDRPPELDARRVKSIEEAQAKGIIDPSIAPHEVTATGAARPSPSRSGVHSHLLADEPKPDRLHLLLRSGQTGDRRENGP